MKVKAITNYFDMKLNRDVLMGEVIECDKARAEALVDCHIVKVVEEKVTVRKKPTVKTEA